MFRAISSAVVIIVTREMAIATLYFLFIVFPEFSGPDSIGEGLLWATGRRRKRQELKGQDTDKAQLTLPTGL